MCVVLWDDAPAPLFKILDPLMVVGRSHEELDCQTLPTYASNLHHNQVTFQAFPKDSRY